MSCYYFPWRIILWVLFVLQFMIQMADACFIEERIALMRISSSLLETNESQEDLNKTWGRSEDCCTWERVTCNNSTRVSGLNLYGIHNGDPCWNLNLTIFSSFRELELLDLSFNSVCVEDFDGLQGLTLLRYLNLSANYLTGDNALESLGRLGSLETIYFACSSISGALQNIAFTNLKNLRELDLGYNQLNGSIPASLLELPRLEYLDLSGNLLEGHIPIGLSSNISLSLKTLKLAGNNLNGKFDFFWLRNSAMLKEVDLSGNTELAFDVRFLASATPFQLYALSLSGCNLGSSIIAGPNLFVGQRKMQFLDLSNNNLAGTLPNLFSNETALIYLDLGNNFLVGSLDLMWQQQSNLQFINMSMNLFKGQVPTDISSVFPNLTLLDASYNNISGHLPSSLCNHSVLEFVDLSNNKLTGEVPSCLFTDCSSLEYLKLSNNNLGGPILGGANKYFFNVGEIYLDSNYFEGSLPNNLSGHVSIMDFHDNKLSGQLDMSFWNVSTLEFFSVASNILAGQIHPMICNMTGLGYLDISDNDFEGSIPNCSGSKLPLYVLNMSSNALSGFPSHFFNSSSVMALDLSYNQFKGSIDWIKHLSQIKFLLLGANMFEGQISADLCHLRYLNIVDLSHNRLSGSVPPCIGGISFGNTDGDYEFWYTYVVGFGPPYIDSDVPRSLYAVIYSLCPQKNAILAFREVK